MTSPSATPDKGPGGPSLRQRESRLGWALISPTLIVVLVAVVGPILWTVATSFQRLRLRTLAETGLFTTDFSLDSFVDVVNDRGFWDSIWVTVVYSVVGTFLAIALGLVAALLVRHPFRGRTLVRASMLLPYIAPVVAVTFVWSTMLDPNLGIINALGREWLGWGEPIPFLSQRSRPIDILGFEIRIPLALITVIVFQAWRYFPFAFLFILARLQALPAEPEEAARVDGATPTQRFRYIMLPQLMGVIALLAVLRFIWTFNEFDDIYLLTGGGGGTEVVSVRVYEYLIGRGDLSAAAALSMVLALSLAVLLFVYFRFAQPRGVRA
jgi:multiple sugar transport system permease protein